MKKILKYALWTIAVVVVVAVAGAAYLIATFDPNTYKPQIIQAVKDKTERTLKLDGDIKLAFFPNIGVDLSKVSLSEFRSDQQFLALDHAHVALAVIPLFSKQAIVEAVDLSGIKAQLIKHKDGTLNISDLTSSSTPAPATPAAKPAAAVPIQFDIASVSVSQSEFDYRDEGSGAQYAVQNFTLQTGRIADATPTDASMSARITASKPKLDVTTQLKTKLTLDLAKKYAELNGLNLQVKGSMDNFSKLDVGVNSNIKADLNAQNFNLANLVLTLAAEGDSLPGKAVNTKLQGTAQADLKNQNAAIKLAGGLLQSQVTLDANVSNFAKPAIRFTLDVDQFDADPYLPQKSASGGAAPAPAAKDAAPAAKPAAAAPEQPLDLSALRNLTLDGTVKVGTLKAFNVKMSQVQVGIKSRNGLLNVDPLALALYQGTLKGSIAVNAAPAVPTFTINAALNNVDVGALAKDAANLDLIEGRGNMNLAVNTQGNLVSALKKRLGGTFSMNLANGAIKGINLPKLVQNIQSLSKDSNLMNFGVSKDEKTAFNQFSATFKIANGVAHNDDLLVQAPMLRITGNGDIDVGNSNLNYTAKVTGFKNEDGKSVTVPLILSGPFSAFSYKVDLASMLTDIAKQQLSGKVDEAKAKAKTEIQNQLQNGLKGLFGK
jgi:AsmA protein